MLKRTILIAGSAAIALCGAMTTAHAGQLKLTLRDVNVNLTDNKSLTEHTDKDLSPDLNGSLGPNGILPDGKRSVDKGFIPIRKEVGGETLVFKHVSIAEERMGGTSNPIGGFYEIDVFEITGAATFSPTTRFDISIGGSADPWFKQDLNCANAIRAGSDNVHSLSANTASGGQPILAGQREANCNVGIQTGSGEIRPDSTVGWLLPIEIKNCVAGAELIVSMTVTRQDPVTNVPTEDSFSHTIAVCKDSIEAAFAGSDLKIDYFTDFRSFLVGEEHEPTLWANVGRVVIDLHQNLVDLKETNKESHTNVFDVSDISDWHITFQFDNLRGIADMCLTYDGGGGSFRVCADQMDYDLDQARFWLSNSEIRNLFGLKTKNGFNKGDKDEGYPVDISIHAFGPKSDSRNNGPIDHQLVVVSRSDIDLRPTTCSGPHCVKFFSPESEGVGSMIVDLQKTGINFGPFDWVADDNSQVRSFFRVTGIPKESVEDLKGLLIVENASDGKEFDGVYKVDFDDDAVSNHELLLTSGAIRDLLADAGMPDQADWGRADLSFTFFVGKEGIKMDMDRLMNTNGTFAPYGDNANDAFSLKARSCDDGRFGPHVANKLDPRFVGLLTHVCGIGEISRRNVFRPQP